MDVDGYFNANDDPAIQIDLGGGAIEILIDTGFGGWLILSNSQAAGLALRFEGFEEFDWTRLHGAHLLPRTRLARPANHSAGCCELRYNRSPARGPDA